MGRSRRIKKEPESGVDSRLDDNEKQIPVATKIENGTVDDDKHGGLPSPRRSSRKRKAVSYDEKKIGKIIGLEEVEDKNTRRGRGLPIHRKAITPRIRRDTDSEQEEDNTQDEDVYDDSEECSIEQNNDLEEVSDGGNKKPRAKRRKTEEGSPVCIHCGKSFSSFNGLKYHLERFVCRIQDCKDPKIIKMHKRGRGKINAKGNGKEYKKIRGELKDRTCKECGRVFTSILGLQYHVEKKVCLIKANRAKQQDPFPILRAGEKFVTSYGVVQVIKDDRAIPTAPVIKDLSKITITYRKQLARYQSNLKKFYTRRQSQLRYRKQKINALYEQHKVSQESLFKAYLDPFGEKMKQKAPENPAEPPEAFPDRIVECKLIADQRIRFMRDRRDEQDESLGIKSVHGNLYLRRRVLTEVYVEGGAVFFCGDCGRSFNNAPSHTYHMDNKPCKRRFEIWKSKREKREEMIQIAVKAMQNRESLIEKGLRTRPTKKQKKIGIAMYPEVVLALGFKLVKETFVDYGCFLTKAASKYADASGKSPSDTQGQNSVKDQTEATETDQTSFIPELNPITKEQPTMEDPRAVLDDLRKELKRELKRANDAQVGSMYKEVYQSLGFRYPGLKTITKSKKKKTKTVKKKKRRPKPAPVVVDDAHSATPPQMQSMIPLAPTIDPQALVDEVLAGRYPSMKLYEGEHNDVCGICRDEGNLLFCDFCENSIHWTCFRSKYTTKKLEPGEDFMCHRCIGVVATRRGRAEKRRLRKRPQSDLSDYTAEGKQRRRYEEVAEQGKRISELTELLRDAQDRLNQSVIRMEMNNVRRRMMAGV